MELSKEQQEFLENVEKTTKTLQEMFALNKTEPKVALASLQGMVQFICIRYDFNPGEYTQLLKQALRAYQRAYMKKDEFNND